MKNIWLLWVLSLSLVLLAWCNYKCSNTTSNENEGLDKAVEFCIDNWWTHSLIHSQTAVYWECTLPNWVVCDDQEFLAWECQNDENQGPDTSNIDTEENRLTACEENVSHWIDDIEEWKLIEIEWGDESEGWASFVRNWIAKYTKEWSSWNVTLECVADFVDWSTSVTYGDPSAEE